MAATDIPAANLLAGETSPYLLQHADNPVHWQPWGDAAFERARAEGKPVMLSVGYAACHWCHVMAHECFENPEIAAVINALTVPVKVDREERPDLDVIYQSALAALGQQGGWPLTMFLTAERVPFWGGTYFPPEPRWGRPGFPDVLRAVARTYQEAPERVAENGRTLGRALASLADGAPAAGNGLDPRIVGDIADRVLPMIDRRWGGLAGAPKFPQPGLLRLLWRAHLATDIDPALASASGDAVLRSLRGMLLGGIWDHLGGGLARYSTDARWLVPHFEKMLYDNALLVSLLAFVHRAAPDPLFADRVQGVIDWLDREMVVGEGGFAAALDADSEGEEGRYYVWTEAEIDAVLGPAAPRFKAAYGVDADGNWPEEGREGRTILNRSHALDLPPDAAAAAEAALAEDRATLLSARAGRVPPGRDDKLLADWNGLMIMALAEAGCAFDRPDWIRRAARAFAFVTATLATGPGRLAHSWRAGRHGPPGLLDDYAAMARAALALFEATGETTYLDHARDWVATLEAQFAHPEGGYAMTPADGEALIVRVRTAFDAATPSGNALALGALARLWHITGETAYAERARALIRAFAGALDHNATGLSSWIDAALTLDCATQVVVVAPRPDDPDAAVLLRTARATPAADILVVPVVAADTAGGALPPGHPAAGKGPVDGRAAAYVCRDFACLPPITAPAALASLLAGGAA